MSAPFGALRCLDVESHPSGKALAVKRIYVERLAAGEAVRGRDFHSDSCLAVRREMRLTRFDIHQPSRGYRIVFPIVNSGNSRRHSHELDGQWGRRASPRIRIADWQRRN